MASHHHENLHAKEQAVVALRRHMAGREELPNGNQIPAGLPSASTIRSLFGSWNAYVAAAGFAPRPHRSWDGQQVIDAIQAWAREHDGHPPTREDWVRATASHPNQTQVRRLFGTWKAATKAAGFSPLNSRPMRWTDQAILDALRRWEQVRGSPLPSDWDNTAPDHPTRGLVTKRFGSWDAALRAAGLSAAQPRHHWSGEQIIRALQAWTTAHKRPPTSSDWRHATSDHPGRVHVWRRFGSWEAALTAAQLTSDSSEVASYTLSAQENVDTYSVGGTHGRAK
jgi:hypothetical protein